MPPVDPVTEVTERGTLVLDAVTFAYPGAEEPVLRGVDLQARPGQTVAIIGSTGAGKSTLVNLVPRLFDVTSGTVYVDGVDVRELAPEVLWSRLGLVPQKAFLFSGTIADNLRYGKADASEEQMWEALEIAQAPRLRGGDARRARVERSPRAAPTSPAASASGWRSPARSSDGPRSTCSTTRSRPSTSTTDARLRAALRAGHPRRHGRHRRPAGLHHPRRRRDRRPRGRRGRRSRHPRRAPRDVRRPTARSSQSQLTVGGGSMSDDHQAGARHPQADRAHRGRPRPRSRPDGRRHGRSEGQRLRRRRSGGWSPAWRRTVPRRSPSSRLTVVSVLATAFGPRVLGRATDLIFTGLIGGRLPAGLTKAEAVELLRQRGDDQVADMVSGMDVVPGQGVDFDAVGQVLLLVLAIYVGAAAARVAGRAGSSTTWCRGPCGGCAPTSRTRSPAAAGLLRPAAARRAAQPGHQRHRQRQPDPPADAEPAAHLGADRGRACSG